MGECNALFIPNYSSFSFPSISLTRARGKSVFFRRIVSQGEEEELLMEEKEKEKEERGPGESVLINLWKEMSSLVVLD